MAVITRNISGRGELLLPSAELTRSSQIYLYVSVIRRPSSQFLNLNWNPERSEFAKLTFRIGAYVYQEYTIRYAAQAFLVHSSQAAQNFLALTCAYDGILETFENLANCINECTPFSKTNLISNFPYERYIPDTLSFKCYADAAIQVTLSTTDLQFCNQNDGTPLPPLDPPNPPEPVPPGTPLNDSNYPVSDAYPGRPNETEPFPTDTDDDGVLVGAECDIYDVVIRYRVGSEVNEIVQETFPVYAPVGEGFTGTLESGGEAVFLECRGVVFGGDGCVEFGDYVLVSTSGDPYTFFEVVSVTFSPLN